MSEPTESVEPRRVKIPTWLAVGVLIAALVAGAFFMFSQPERSAAPAPATSSAALAPAQPSAPSSSPTPSASPTERPLLTADESLTAELGRGYELRDDRDNIVSLCEATRFVAAYNPYVGAPQPGNSFTLRTAEGPIDLTPYSNDVDGYRGVISASC